MVHKKAKQKSIVEVVEPDDSKGLEEFVEIFEKVSRGENVQPIFRTSYESKVILESEDKGT